MNKNNIKKVNFMELHRTRPDDYTLILGYDGPEMFHNFVTFEDDTISYYWSYNASNRRTMSTTQIDIIKFKYLESLRKYCAFGVRFIKGSSSVEIEIQRGLGVIVQILLKNEITDTQVIQLNQSYKKLIDL